MSSVRIVVTGNRGQVVTSLRELGPAQGVEVVAVGRPVLDLSDPSTVAAAIAQHRPQIIVSAAAYTDTERAETEPDRVEAVNVRGAGAVAACARELGVPLIHLSTGYVFDGTNPNPYRETDPVAPLNGYGRSKLAGELAVTAAGPEHVILRTSLVFSPVRPNFVIKLLKFAEQRDQIEVVADQVGNPTAAADFAEGILTLVSNLARNRANKQYYGTFHLASQGPIKWAEFADAIFAISAERGGPSARVVPIKSAEFRSLVRRPPNSRLDCSKIAASHGIALPHWQSSLRTCIDRILKEWDAGD